MVSPFSIDSILVILFGHLVAALASCYRNAATNVAGNHSEAKEKACDIIRLLELKRECNEPHRLTAARCTRCVVFRALSRETAIAVCRVCVCASDCVVDANAVKIIQLENWKIDKLWSTSCRAQDYRFYGADEIDK